MSVICLEITCKGCGVKVRIERDAEDLFELCDPCSGHPATPHEHAKTKPFDGWDTVIPFNKDDRYTN